MSTDLQVRDATALVERVVIGGDLSGLSPAERVQYYQAVCQSAGLNPLTRPLEYIELDGKLVLYATRGCTDQLRSNRAISIEIVSRERVENVYVVTARARTSDGRTDDAIGAVPLEREGGEWKTAQNGKRYFAKDGTLQPLAPTDLANALMKAECVPFDSEILTRDGWKTHDHVVIGEEVLAYDVATDICRWTPIRNVTTYKDVAVSRLASPNGLFSIRCTQDHSWVVRMPPYKPSHRTDGSRGLRGPYKNRGHERLLIEASRINTCHRLVLAAAEPGDDDSLLSPVEAAVLGWAVTDGTIQRRGSHVRIGICQSKEVNFPVIRETMALAAGSDVREIITPACARTFPNGRTYDTKAQSWWYLPSAVGRALLQKAGYQDRYDLPRIVTRLSSPARKAMIQAMMLAEGDKRGIFANGDRYILDAFEILCALEGYATGTRTPKDTIFTQRKKKTRHVAGSFLSLTADGAADVWCPTTDYGTWIMRQNGRVMITGNTKAKRRATLSICGLSLADESELDGLPAAAAVPSIAAPAVPIDHESAFCDLLASLDECTSLEVYGNRYKAVYRAVAGWQVPEYLHRLVAAKDAAKARLEAAA